MRTRHFVLAIALAAFAGASATEAQTYMVLHSFGTLGSADGSNPAGSLVQSGSVLYGFTFLGGLGGGGTIFKYDLTTNTETLLHGISFLAEGGNPYGSPLQSNSSSNLLFGLSDDGSSTDDGTLFQYDLTTNTDTPLHAFVGGSIDGSSPYGSLIQSGSILYGMTYSGGATIGTTSARGTTHPFGTIFQYDLISNTESVLHSFGGSGDGALPAGALIQSGSNLYGPTSVGGTNGDGTLIDYNVATNTETVLYSFAGGSTDVANPLGSLIQSGSMLYGVAGNSIFQYNLSTNHESLLYTFAGSPNDGAGPLGSLLQSGNDLFGMTEGGGSSGDGTVFDYNLATNTEGVLHSFTDTAMNFSNGSLIESGSTLYGMTYTGGTNNTGVIFSLTVPEPASASLLALSSIALLARRRQLNGHRRI